MKEIQKNITRQKQTKILIKSKWIEKGERQKFKNIEEIQTDRKGETKTGLTTETKF
jgi:hypothetical protein